MTNMTKPPSSRSVLRRLVILVAVAIAVFVYAYGWNATDINLDEIQDAQRQSHVKRAARGLLSPDIFTRDSEDESFYFEYEVGCANGELATQETPHEEGAPYLVFSPGCADIDQIVDVEGFHFPPNAIAGMRILRESGQNLPFKLAGENAEAGQSSEDIEFDIDSSGYFKIRVKVPRGRGLSGAVQQIELRTISPTGVPRFSDITHTVIRLMIETIFLALMATTLAVPISVAISFWAARNLMRQVRLPLGNVMVGFVLLPVGGWLSALLLGPVGHQGVSWGEDVIPGLIAGAAAVGVFAVVSRLLTGVSLEGPLVRVRSILLNALLLALMVFLLGVVGGLMIWVGGKLDFGVFRYVGQVLDTVGTLIGLIIGGVAALGGALLAGSEGAAAAAGVLRSVRQPLSNLIGAVLGLLGGAILMGTMAYIGTQAVLPGLLPPLVGAVLGAQALYLVYKRILRIDRPRRDETDADQAIRSVVFALGAIAAFVVTAYELDLIRAIVDARPPSILEWNLIFGLSVRIYIAKSAIIGAVLGGVAGGLAGTHVMFPLGMSVYNATRTTLNAVRSIEPLIMGLVFVIWAGLGPFAGVLALTLHSVAALGKLYSEQVENIDAGPLEAIQATGANRLQTIIYGVVPQIVPPYIAFTMYRWDINVRMSTIIGFVGGGGIGFVVQQQINLLQYDQAGVAVLAIAIVVSALDYTSAWIRERIV